MEQRTEDTEKEEQAQVGADYGPPSSHASGSGFDIEVSTPSPLETHSSARIYSSSSGYGAAPSCSSGPPNQRSESLMGYIFRGRADHTYSSVPPTATQQNENLTGNIFTGPSYSSDQPNTTQSSGNLMGNILTGYGASSPSYSLGPPTATQQNENLLGSIFTIYGSGPSYSSRPPKATQRSGNLMGNVFTGYGASPSYSSGPPTTTQQNENLMGSIFTVYGAGPSYSSRPPKATQRSENLMGNIQYASTSYSGGYIPGTCVPSATALKVHGCLSTSASPTCNRTVTSTVTSSAYQLEQQKVDEALSYFNEIKFKFGNQPQVNQRQKVEETLSFIDKVRITFINQPQVYNDFMDIMKEFKAKSIDFRGLLQHVKNLFKDHPELIVGFNDYLPPRYRIADQSTDQGHSSQVSISKPSPSSVTAVSTHVPAGMVTQRLSIPGNLNTSVRFVSIPATPTQSSPVATKIVHPIHRPTHHTAAAVASASTVYQRPACHTAAAVASASAVHQNVSSATAATKLVPAVASAPSPSPVVSHHDMPPSTAPLPVASSYISAAHPVSHADHNVPEGRVQPVDINQAINYVNKVKLRFQDQPDQYKKFIEIVRNYQKEQRNMMQGILPTGKYLTEAEVYSQVAKLFQHHDDLLAEFGQLLPEVTSHQASHEARLSSSSDHSTVVKRSPGPKPGDGNTSCSSGGRAASLPTMDPGPKPGDGHTSCSSGGRAASLPTMDPGPKPGDSHTSCSSGGRAASLPTMDPGPKPGDGHTSCSSRGRAASLPTMDPGPKPGDGHTSRSSRGRAASLPTMDPGPKPGDGITSCSSGGRAASLPTMDLGPKPGDGHTSCSSRDRAASLPTMDPGPKPGDDITSCSSGGRAASLPTMDQQAGIGSSKSGHSSGQIKSSSSLSASVPGPGVSGTQTKKHKLATLRNITITEAVKYSTLNDFAFFDKVRKALKNREAYENLLRYLKLFNDEIVSSSELIELVTPFLGKFPELFHWFKKFMRRSKNLYQLPGSSHNNESETSHSNEHSDRSIETLEEIDYTTCKRLGSSYCALPENYKQPRCSGRTPLCNEVLNDTWASFPSWPERSTFVTSRKTKYEEFIYRCEDEMFEVDLVIETNTATISVFERVKKRMSQMSPEDITKFRLDDCLGGSSPTIHLRAVRRIYGDKAPQIIDGLKNNPSVAVPVVLRRLKSKGEEWRKAQQGFNKAWREQTEKYYLKSLDYQSRKFKQNDNKALRPGSLFDEIKMIFDERHEQAEEATGDVLTGPHLTLPYKKKCMLDDTANLLIDHVERQTGIHKEEKDQIQLILRHLIPDMFFHPRQDLSEDEREEEEKTNGNKQNVTSNTDQSCKNTSTQDPNDQELPDIEKPEVSLPCDAESSHPGESYTLFYCNKYWYNFLRLHQIICDRLANMYERARVIADEESNDRKYRKESLAVALRIKPKSEIEVEDYYPAFLGMIKNLLDGNIDNRTFEGKLREMFGNYAYLSFTIEKVISYAVRQLQNLVTDEMCREVLDLYHQESKHGGTGGDCQTSYLRIAAELSYQQKAENLLSKENCFKIVIYHHDCQLTVELLDNEENSRLDPEPHEKSPVFGEGCSASAADGAGCTQTSATVTASEIRDCDDDQLDLSAEYNDEVVL